tara:strand:+ start:492 stop:842 length:351 start_codon:yes stop_codon:yes gene_type:complete
MESLVDKWIEYDDSIKELTKQLKEMKQSKEDLSQAIVNEMIRTKTDTVSISSGGRLVNKTVASKSSINQEYIEETLTEFFKLPHTHDAKKLACETTEELMNKREVVEKQMLRRVKN